MKGYDIDGVITIGIKPESDAVIITGRSYEEAPETYKMLRDKGLFNAVYFNSVPFVEKSLENAGLWKAEMINKLRITEFYEDDNYQAEIIRKNTLNSVQLHMVYAS